MISATLPSKRPSFLLPDARSSARFAARETCAPARGRADGTVPWRRDGRLPPVQRRDLRRSVSDLQAAARRVAGPLPRRVRLLVRVALRGRLEPRAGPAQPDLEVRHDLHPSRHQADADLAESLGPGSAPARARALVLQPAVQARRGRGARAARARVRARGDRCGARARRGRRGDRAGRLRLVARRVHDPRPAARRRRPGPRLGEHLLRARARAARQHAARDRGREGIRDVPVPALEGDAFARRAPGQPDAQAAHRGGRGRARRRHARRGAPEHARDRRHRDVPEGVLGRAVAARAAPRSARRVRARSVADRPTRSTRRCGSTCRPRC